jgi:TRAP-type mannitol/chloroaromatic compound transport system permease small subunit
MVMSTSWKFVVNSYMIMEGSPDPGGIPFRFIVKGCIPAGFLLLLIQGISLGMHSLLQIIGIETAKEEQS